MNMKKVLLLAILHCSIQLIAQTIPGVTKISKGRSGMAFMFKDSKNRVWSGYGGMQRNNSRIYNGLMYTDSTNKDTSLITIGIITDGLEWQNAVYFSSDKGLYRYKNDSMLQYSDPVNSNTLQLYKDSLYIGTTGSGLYRFKDGNFTQQRIMINNRFYDTINDLASDGKSLWIASNSGLIQYQNGKFTLISTPLTSTTSRLDEFRILSVETDGLGRVWFSNASPETIVTTFYVMDKTTITPVKSIYSNYCELSTVLPWRIVHLTRARNGTILLGTRWGLIEFGPSLKYFPADEVAFNDSMYSSNASLIDNEHFNMAFEANDGHYFAACQSGIFEIDRKVYSLENFSQNALKNYKRSVSKIHINEIDANISNDGSWFNGDDLFRIFSNNPKLQLSSIPCRNMMYSSGLWLGAKIAGDSAYYVSAQTYKKSVSDYTPGPISLNTLEFDKALASKYNKIWSVTRQEIEEFLKNRNSSNYQIPESILNWPANAEPGILKEMAPYVDVDQNSVYEPNKGDYPRIKGDQMLWWVFNDAIKHSTKNAQPLKFQINAMCYAYNNLRTSAKDSNNLANRTILFDFSVYNLSNNQYNEVYIGIMNDPDLGYYADDYVTCDTVLNIGYVCNSDNIDDQPPGFGVNPPMLACQFLNHKMHYFTGYNNSSDPVYGNPKEAKDFYSFMKGPLVRDLSIYKKPCQIPGSFVEKGDRRFMMSAKIGDLSIGQSFTLSFAYFVQYDKNKNYLVDDCDAIQTSGNRIKNWHNNNNFPSHPYWTSDINSILDLPLTIYPNPAQTILNIETKLAYSSAQIADMSGKIYLITDTKNQIDISELSSGVYTIKLLTESGPVVKLFIKE